MGLAFCSECSKVSITGQFQSPELIEVNDNDTAWMPPDELNTQFYLERPQSLNATDGNNGIAIKSAGRVLRPEFLALDSPRPRSTRGPSLRKRLIERKLIHSSPATPWSFDAERKANISVNAENDNALERLSETFFEDNSLKQLRETNRLAQSMVVKGDEMREELIRQGKVTEQANRDVFNTEQDINETSSTLRGMTFRGKLANMVWRKNSKRRQYNDFEYENDRPYHLPRSMSLPAKFASPNLRAKTKQQRIKNDVNQLIQSMDTLRDQQLGIAEELEYQDPHLKELGTNMARVNDKMKRQTRQINDLQQT